MNSINKGWIHGSDYPYEKLVISTFDTNICTVAVRQYLSLSLH